MDKVCKFEVVEVVLVQCNLVDNQYRLSLRYYILLRPENFMLFNVFRKLIIQRLMKLS